MTVTARLRILAGPFLLLGIALSCGDDPTGPTGTPLAALVASRDTVVIEPGDSVQVRSEGRDQGGMPTPPASAQWRSLAPSVASVSSTGLVRGLAAGGARIVVELRGRADTIHVIVPAAIDETRLSSRVDTLGAIGDEITLKASSRSATGPRHGRYSVMSRDSAVALPSFEAESGTLRITARSPGATYVVVKEARGTADSVRVVVLQRAARIALPSSVNGAPGGSAQLAASAFDARAQPIASPSIIWRSSNSTVASVTATGLVRFHALGSAFIEAGSGDTATAIVSVTVAESAAPAVRYQLDSVVTGTGLLESNLYINMLNLPGGGAPTVASLDPGIAEVSSVLNYSTQSLLTIVGRRAGVTRIVASLPGAKSDTLLVRVSTARIQLLDNVYFGPIDEDEIALGVNQNYFASVRDSAGTVRDRGAPVTVTLRSSDTSVLRIAEMRHQLTLDAGSSGSQGTVVIPVAPGRAVLHATAPGLLADSVVITVGARPRLRFRQRVHTVALGYRTHGEPYMVGTSIGFERRTDVAVTFTRRNPAIATAPESLSLASNYVARGIDYTGVALGTDTIIATAPGYDPDTAILIVTSPQLVPLDAMTATAAGGAAAWLQVTDSLGVPMVSLRPTVFRLTSSNTSVARPPEYGEIPEAITWQWPVSVGIRDSGTAVITIADTSRRIAPRSVTVRVVLDTSLQLGNQHDRLPLTIGMRQRFGDGAFYVLREAHAPTAVSFRSTNPAVLRVPDSLVIGNVRGSNFSAAGGDSPGSASIVAYAAGYRPVTLGPIDVGRPKLQLIAPETSYVGATGQTVQLVARDHRGAERIAVEDVRVDLVALDGGIGTGVATIPAGSSRSAAIPIAVTAQGALRLEARDPRSATYRYDSDTAVIHAALPPLTLGSAFTVAVGQRITIVVGRPPNASANPVTISMARSGSRSTSAATVTMAAGLPAATYDIVGRAVGTDTLTATAPGYAEDRVRIVVTEGHLIVSASPPATFAVGQSMTVRFSVSDSTRQIRPVDAPTTFSLWGTGVTFSDGENPITSITVPAGQMESPAFRVIAAKPGPATVEITNLNYVPARLVMTVVP